MNRYAKIAAELQEIRRELSRLAADKSPTKDGAKALYERYKEKHPKTKKTPQDFYAPKQQEESAESAESKAEPTGELKVPKKLSTSSLTKFLKQPGASKALKGADLSGIKALDLKAKNVDFRGTDLGASSLNDGDFSGSDFRGAKLRNTSISRSSFKGADFSDTTLDGTRMMQCDFTGANLTGTNFKGTDLLFANMSGADVDGADFTTVSKGDLKSINFSGAKNLNKAKFPEGFTPESK